MNGTKKKLTLTVPAVFVLTAMLLTSCVLPYSTVHEAETAPAEELTDGPDGSSTTAPTTAPTTVPTVAPTAAPTDAPTTAPTDAPTAVPTDVPTDPPTQAPTEEPTEDPAVVSARLALDFVQAHIGTWTSSQAPYFMKFTVSGGVPYVTMGDWTTERPTFTGKVTGAEYDDAGRLLLIYDFTGTKWTSQNGYYRVYREEELDGNPSLLISNVAAGKGFSFIKYPYFQYPMKTATSGCTVAEFMGLINGYWSQYQDQSGGNGYLFAFLDGDRVVIQIREWDTAEIVDSYTAKKITKINSAVGNSYKVEAISDIVATQETATFIFAADGSTVKTDINITVPGTKEPWTYTKDSPDNHKEVFDMFMRRFKGTWYNAADNTYIQIGYVDGKPWFRTGTWGSAAPDFSGEIAAAGFRQSEGAYMFGALYEYGKKYVGAIIYVNGTTAMVKYRAGFNGQFAEYKYDASKQLP
ncbi:MAG: PT domain-containing protein [Clostridia bacterium]|nr:PT domain-containing protein [Clostridia bacterium]